MKNRFFYIYLISFALLASSLGACKKNITADGTFLKERSVENKQKILKQLKSESYVLFLTLPPPGSMAFAKTPTAAVPLIFDFDVDANVVRFRSYYGTLDRDIKFSIKDGVGTPILSFDTRSIISDIYSSGVHPAFTDYMFRIIDITDSYIELQAYRKGGVYKSEGGIPFKIYKLSKYAEIAKWLASNFDLSKYPKFLSPDGTESEGKLNLKLTLEFIKPRVNAEGKEEKVSGEYYFMISKDVRDPTTDFSRGNRVARSNFLNQRYGFTGAQSLNFHGATRLNASRFLIRNSYATFWGTNSLFFAEHSSAPLFSKFGTPYLLIEEMNEKFIKGFAVDTNGDKIVTGTIELLE